MPQLEDGVSIYNWTRKIRKLKTHKLSKLNSQKKYGENWNHIKVKKAIYTCHLGKQKNQLVYLSRHCFPIRPGKCWAMVDHFLGPYFLTNSAITSSSWRSRSKIVSSNIKDKDAECSRITMYYEAYIYLFRPWTFDKFRIKNLLPPVQTLYISPVFKTFRCTE